MASDLRSRWFLKPWTITLPSYPSLKFFRATPALHDELMKIFIDPDNTQFLDRKGKVWTQESIKEQKEIMETRYHEANAGKFHFLDMLIEFEGQIVGYGNCSEIVPGHGNVGIGVSKSVRGRGIGKASMQTFTQIGFELFEEMHCGTMKANKPMQALAESLGFEGKDEIVDIPGRGIVAEITYEIHREKWKYIDMDVEFSEATPKEVDKQ